MYRLWIVVICFAFVTYLPSSVGSQGHPYTAEEMLTAYETGNFRVIQTRSIDLLSSSDGAYVAAWYDGVYRVADGTRIMALEYPRFSPDGKYVVQAALSRPLPEDGIYRLEDGQRIIAFGRDASEVKLDANFMYINITFSANGEYVAVSEEGIYHLPDGKKILDTHQRNISFNPDNTLVATADGVFRLSDGHQLFKMYGTAAEFSPDGLYVYAANDGLYSINEGQKLFSISGEIGFTPDSAYVVGRNSVYRLIDGKLLYSLAERMSGSPEFSNNSEYMIVSYGDGIFTAVYRIRDGEMLFNSGSYQFSPNGEYIAVGHDGVYRLDNKQKIFDITGVATYSTSSFSADGRYLAVSGDGVYRLQDGQKLIGIKPSFTGKFSPSGAFLAIDYDGVYRLEDAQKLFEITEAVSHFTDDETAVIVGQYDNDTLGVYGVQDGRKIARLELLNIPAGLMAVGNVVLVVDASQQIERLPFVYTNDRLRDGSGDHYPYMEGAVIGSDGAYLAILDEKDGWYQVSIGGKTGWVSSSSSSKFYIPQ